MTGDDVMISEKAIGICRKLNRQLANECHAKGISPEDIVLASLYASFDIAEVVKGQGLAAIDWLRSGLDIIEHQLLSGETTL